jgi:pilus assembly protein Flp/PilA
MSFLRQVSDFLRRARHASDGQGLAEYALILTLIALVVIVALIFLGGQVSAQLSDIGNELDNVN